MKTGKGSSVKTLLRFVHRVSFTNRSYSFQSRKFNALTKMSPTSYHFSLLCVSSFMLGKC